MRTAMATIIAINQDAVAILVSSLSLTDGAGITNSSQG